MSETDPSVDRLPSRRVAVGAFVATIGYLVALFGVVMYAWGDIHEVYNLPVLAVPIIALVVAVGGAGLIWTERA